MIDNTDISLRVFVDTFHAQNVVDSQFAFKECKQFIQRSVRENRSAVKHIYLDTAYTSYFRSDKKFHNTCIAICGGWKVSSSLLQMQP